MAGNKPKRFKNFVSILSIICVGGCTSVQEEQGMRSRIYQTSASGDQLKAIQYNQVNEPDPDRIRINIDSSLKFQRITGFGGAFTESTARLVLALSEEQQKRVLEAYFGESGARYSLARTHMNSCDFSTKSYSYVPLEGDTMLSSFTLNEDRNDIIPMIKMAQELSANGFKLIASPWTAPPWMKDNNSWFGGKLKKEYYRSWARFFTRYANEMAAEGIAIWAFTVENEPLGNDSHWESMHFTAEEMRDFIVENLGPELRKSGVKSRILVYDQNRDEEMRRWADVLLKDSSVLEHIYGTAVHWYSSTVDWMPGELQYAHNLAPQKHIIHTEGCVDAEVPKWRNDAWYWSREATDWGYDWAPEHLKKDHPKYVPVYRYARDIIGCMNNWVEGWVDWNMVLDKQGGPNHASNWCVAPVLADTAANEVYFTPLYYVMSHFSRYIQPGAIRIGVDCSDEDIMTTAVLNPNGEIVLIALNTSESTKKLSLELGGQKTVSNMPPHSIQTIVLD